MRLASAAPSQRDFSSCWERASASDAKIARLTPFSCAPTPCQSFFRDAEIVIVDLEADKGGNPAVASGDCGAAKTQEGIQCNRLLGDAVKPETIFRQFNRKRGRVGPLLIPALDRFVGDKPCIATTPSVPPLGVVPPFDIRLVLVGHTYAQPIELNMAALGKMEDEFLTAI